jgi:hypothetical protein
MKRKVAIALTYIATMAVCYWLMFYVNPILGFIGIGLGINILDKVFMKGAE